MKQEVETACPPSFPVAALAVPMFMSGLSLGVMLAVCLGIAFRRVKK